jgi:hypothetical protein
MSTSERLVHDKLALQAESGLKGIYRNWKKRRKTLPFFITWPEDTVYALSGRPIDGPCLMELPQDKRLWRTLMKEAVRVTKAYGILFVEQRENDVQATFETRHGARCWTMPIVRSGDVDVLKEPIVTDDQERLDLLWRPLAN